jgi:hypothetical protein
VSSRLARDLRGRLIVVVTTPSEGLPIGTTFRVLGDSISTGTPGDPGEYFFVGTKTGRFPVPPAAGRPGRTVLHS